MSVLSEVMAPRRTARDSVVDVGLDETGHYTVEAGRFAGFLDKVKENPTATLITLAVAAGLAAVVYDEIRPLFRESKRPAKRSRFDYSRVAR